MLKCNDCGARFEYPKAVKEYRGECFGFPAYETVGYCPECGGWDFWPEEDENEEEEEDE